MPITKTSAPLDATEVAVRGLTSLKRAHGSPDVREAGGGGPQPINASLPIYHIEPDVLSSGGASTGSAQQIGWRYLVGEGGDAQAVEVIGKSVSSIMQGAIAANLERALSIASKIVDSSKPYEARVLVFGRAGSSLLWLHTDGGGDRFFSLGAKPHEVDEVGAMLDAGRMARMRQEMKHSKRTTGLLTSDVDESGG